MVVVGLIGGSGLLKSNLPALKALGEEYLDTAHGRVFLRSGFIAEGVQIVFVQRHDAKASRTYTQPADINYQAVALALKAKVSAGRALCMAQDGGACSTAPVWAKELSVLRPVKGVNG